MELKTKVEVEDGRQDIIITRDFALPVALLYKAFITPEIVEQWMGTRVLKLESKKHGSFHFRTTDPRGNNYDFNGTIHELSPEQRIIRTFEFEQMPFGVQLEILDFEKLGDRASRLRMHTIFQSVAQRDQQLQMPFKQGISMAHDRLEQIMSHSN